MVRRFRLEKVAAIFLMGILSTVMLAVAVPGKASTTWNGFFDEPLPEPARFKSCEELRFYMDRQRVDDPYGRLRDVSTLERSGMQSPDALNEADFTETNIQVEGVDEADVVKTDGKYLYLITQDGDFVIAKVNPAEKAKIIYQKNKESLGMLPEQLFLEKDRIVILGSVYRQSPVWRYQSIVDPEKEDIGRGPLMGVQMWDIHDRATPKKIRESIFEGRSIAARKIDEQIHVVLETSFWQASQHVKPVPYFWESWGETLDHDRWQPVAPCSDIQKPDYDAQSFLTILTLPMTQDRELIKKTVTIGSGQTVYASEKNITIAAPVMRRFWGYREPVIDSRWGVPDYDMQDETVIVRFSFGKDGAEYSGSTKIAGRPINQFALDEHDGYLRIATVHSGGELSTGVVILDTHLQTVGELENLAVGEQFHSARFMGDRVYLVTFQQVDPLFVIDLSNPSQPTVLGELKIPGFSDYLHPISATLLLGVGKDTVAGSPGRVWTRGVKLALFDVSDPTNPKELHKEVIGGIGTSSRVFGDHHAFLYDPKKELLVLPISIPEEFWNGRTWSRSKSTFSGVRVYRVSAENGFEPLGEISHEDGFAGERYAAEIFRSGRIGKTLYTISNSQIQIHSLSDFTRLALLELRP